MSNDDGIPREWIDVGGLPGWVRYRLGVDSVLHSDNDPEATLQVALTHAELAVLVFGAMLVITMFPECGPRSRATLRKLGELSDFQGFLPTMPDDAQ